MVNDLLLAVDSESASVLSLLNLSAAFNTVEPCILLDRLENYFGISDQVLLWLRSYLSERSQCVLYNNIFSEPHVVSNGVPQGSVLGPLLFPLYIAPLGQILCSFGISFHCICLLSFKVGLIQLNLRPV